MKSMHQNLKEGNWNKLSLIEQMANIGSEISRTINWKAKNKKDAQLSFYRALELFELTLDDPKHINRLKEISRTKEMLIDWYLGNQLYQSTDESWQKYFLQFNLAARINL
jgi:hypothetical protein